MNTTPAALGQVKSNHRPFADDLTGRVVIVTGGASGMGAATVRLLVGAGAHVLVVDRNVVEAALRQHGRLDGLVNAAGIIVRAAGHATSDEDWHRIMGVNVSGTFFMCRAALQAMQQVRSGAIVNFGSIWGDLGSAGVAAYCASKGAVHNLTRGLALDHAGDGIRVNAVCPGEVRTPMLQSERSEPVTQELLDRLATTVPMGRLAEPEEIARVVVFLLSDSASYMTGTLVTVDAGFAAR
jgi:meso-butanediol dehydrogenase / (S,S)-butanediol dehydrogenase / diacetyl reductase